MTYNIDNIKEKGLLAYEYVRGSSLYDTALPDGKSDIDLGGIYLAPKEVLFGLSENYQSQISDEKNDITYYELGKWVELLMRANPNALESLYIPKDKVIGDIHPAIQLFIDNREMFLTKECFKSLVGYAYTQIQKATGLNKKINWDVIERKDVLDFCYTFKGQGSQIISEFLETYGLKQMYCGLVNVPNMKDVYAVYYDFAAHIFFEKPDINVHHKLLYSGLIKDFETCAIIESRIENKEFFGYSGIVHPDGTSNQVRLSSIPKHEKPICFMSYNQNGYETHCKKYREYVEWKENRNKARYENNLEGLEKDKEKFYDAKNMMHCFRLLTMCIEVAEGKGLLVDRTNIDRDFLMDVRNRKYTYPELMEKLLDLKARMDSAIEKSNIKDAIDVEFVNNLLLNCRKYFRENE